MDITSLQEIGDRFIRYASINTQSEEGHTTTPSTECQRDLAVLLTKELQEMGAADVVYDEKNCYVYATLKSNLKDKNTPCIGLVAHMDTSDAVAGTVVKPRRILSYDGKDIVLNAEQNIVTKISEFTSLPAHAGKTIIVTDGTSVLGGDDKAGITSIMEAMAFYLSHPEFAHPTIKIAFTPDEEVGNGTAFLDRSYFDCDYAYTLDGGNAGELQFENFNAAAVSIKVHGKSAHPGSAKGIMINAILVLQELLTLLPSHETPYYTEGYEGFFHVENIEGTTDEATCDILIRDHDKDLFAKRKCLMEAAVEQMRKKYGDERIECTITDSYYNMREKIEPQMHLVEVAKEAMIKSHVTPLIAPIRGGTDGCHLSFEGIPCPNLGTGSYHCHSRYEYVCVEELLETTEIIVRIINKYAEYERDET